METISNFSFLWLEFNELGSRGLVRLGLFRDFFMALFCQRDFFFGLGYMGFVCCFVEQ